jgi:molybdenum-dependent DNA-binding transcriptional regulator ModE
MDLRHLRYFVAVAEAGHMTRAAAQLGIQQPPLSMQIRALEQELGVQLLHRHPKGVRLSEGGRLLLPQAQRILQEVQALKLRFEGLAQGARGILSVGFKRPTCAKISISLTFLMVLATLRWTPVGKRDWYLLRIFPVSFMNLERKAVSFQLMSSLRIFLMNLRLN